jgi:hypothetical protein
MARFCGNASTLDSGSGRAAAMSSAFHAQASGDPKAADMMARLTAEEREQVDKWQKPEDVSVMGVVLRYQDAAKEVAVGLTADGRQVAPEDPDCVTPGHLDMGWVVVSGGHRVAYVGDIKKTQWTTLDGPDSLQLIAYGFAWAIKNDCDAFACGIWQATEGKWHWGELIELGSPQAMVLWETVIAAAKNKGGDYATGTHCRGCYSRFRCPAHLVAPGAALDLRPLTRELTKEDAPAVLQLLLQAQAAEDAITVVVKAARDYAARFGLRDPETGKVYRPVVCQGRESLDQKKLKALVEQYTEDDLFGECTKRGAPYEMWRWLRG